LRYPGDGGQEVLGVGVGGGGEEGVGGAVFDDGTLAHDGDVVGDVADDGEVVRDEDHGEIQIAREVGEEVEDLRLDGDVEGGDGFVGNDEFGLGGKGPGDGDALALAAGEFMRVFLHVAGVKADFFHEGCDGVAELGFAEGTALADGFGKGGVDGVARVEGGVGILEDHLEVEPPLADGFVGQGGEVFSLEDDCSGGGALELHDGAREGGFATAGFSDETEDFPLFDGEADSVDGADGGGGFAGEEVFFAGEADVDVLYFEEGHGGRDERQGGNGRRLGFRRGDIRGIRGGFPADGEGGAGATVAAEDGVPAGGGRVGSVELQEGTEVFAGEGFFVEGDEDFGGAFAGDPGVGDGVERPDEVGGVVDVAVEVDEAAFGMEVPGGDGGAVRGDGAGGGIRRGVRGVVGCFVGSVGFEGESFFVDGDEGGGGALRDFGEVGDVFF
jgi:hypothetical protein